MQLINVSKLFCKGFLVNYIIKEKLFHLTTFASLFIYYKKCFLDRSVFVEIISLYFFYLQLV